METRETLTSTPAEARLPDATRLGAVHLTVTGLSAHSRSTRA